jgi:hypothetical protein
VGYQKKQNCMYADSKFVEIDSKKFLQKTKEKSPKSKKLKNLVAFCYNFFPEHFFEPIILGLNPFEIPKK